MNNKIHKTIDKSDFFAFLNTQNIIKLNNSTTEKVVSEYLGFHNQHIENYSHNDFSLLLWEYEKKNIFVYN